MGLSLPARAALGLIALYQRWLSPHKGWRCAHALQTGRRGCSALGARAIRRHGLWTGLGVLRCRFDACALSHEQRRAQQRPPEQPRRTRLHPQAGLCDLDCGPVDGCDVAECACDAADCVDPRKRCGRRSSADAARERIQARQNRRRAAQAGRLPPDPSREP